MTKTSTILIVDDEEIGREMLTALLTGQGYQLAFASNGYEALTQAKQLMPDVILLDVMMPEMDGFEVCRSLRSDPALARVPVIMLTALDDRDSRIQGIEAGADDFISKPFDSFELRARLQTITHLNRYRHLLTEQAKFEWVVEQANEGFLILNEHDHILYANSQARLLLNLTTAQEEMIKESFLEQAAKQYHCEPETVWKRWLKQADFLLPHYLVRPETATAQAFWLQADVMEMSSGSDEKYLVRLRDVTDSILAERRRWSFQQQISHKLKTPLFPLTEGLGYLKDNLSGFSEVETKDFLEMAYAGATRLQAELEGILDYLNVSNTAAYAEWNVCHIADIVLTITAVQEMLELESVQVSQNNIEEPENTYVSLSRRAIELILTELFSNAKKFHPQNSPRIDIHITADSNAIRLQVCDNGLTLSPEQLNQIWIPYYQAEKSFTGEAPGMGLGLSMVASLIWDAGGRCHVYNSEEKKGIVIELILSKSFQPPLENRV
ncbi:MAG TPA: response regulator [Thiotrichaceae bacterium]|nr:response regulator [Thiotrichaceae bacterium]